MIEYEGQGRGKILNSEAERTLLFLSDGVEEGNFGAAVENLLCS